jgi:hypothetical protein
MGFIIPLSLSTLVVVLVCLGLMRLFPETLLWVRKDSKKNSEEYESALKKLARKPKRRKKK